MRSNSQQVFSSRMILANTFTLETVSLTVFLADGASGSEKFRVLLHAAWCIFHKERPLCFLFTFNQNSAATICTPTKKRMATALLTNSRLQNCCPKTKGCFHCGFFFFTIIFIVNTRSSSFITNEHSWQIDTINRRVETSEMQIWTTLCGSGWMGAVE